MIETTKVFTKTEYVTLIPPVSTQDYERLEQSIKKQGWLFMPIIINQDHVVLDGHRRLRACKELGIPISFSKKDFTGKPLEELDYVVSINLDRRHLDEFQRAEIALKYDKLYKKIARDRWASTKYNSESGSEAANKRHEDEAEDFSSSLRPPSKKILPMELKCSIPRTGVLKVLAIHPLSHHSIHKEITQVTSQYK